MSRGFEKLYRSAAGDGACAPLTYNSAVTHHSTEIDELLAAWFRECSKTIEGSLLIEEVRKLLVGILSEQKSSLKRQRQIDRMLRSIREFQNSKSNHD